MLVRALNPARRPLFILAMLALLAYGSVSLWAIAYLFTGRPSPQDVSRWLGLGEGAGASIRLSDSSSFLFRDLAHADDRFFFFPYSYLQKTNGEMPGQTRINELGFRCEELHRYRERNPHARVIVVLGGSAAFSHSVPRDADCFAAQLERRLNRLAKPAPGREFRVVNLGMPSANVLNEIAYFNLFGWHLAPEVVIAHDGFNDLLGGLITSRPLLEKYGITYYKVLYEDWARILAARGAAALSMARLETLPPIDASNTAEMSTDAYLQRLRQLRLIVESSGAKFVSGLQPLSASKSALTALEVSRVASSNPYYRNVYAQLKDVYAVYLARCQPAKRFPTFVNLHEEFARLGSEKTHFVDFMHCNEAGDAVIAESYERSLAKLLGIE